MVLVGLVLGLWYDVWVWQVVQQNTKMATWKMLPLLLPLPLLV